MTIAILGASGMLGRAIDKVVSKKLKEGEVVTLYDSLRMHLIDTPPGEIADSFKDYGIDTVYMCAGRVGGIAANMHNNYSFLVDNTRMALNSIEGAIMAGVKNFYYISSSCAYPVDAPQPFKEASLFHGRVEPTNEGYAMAKLVGTMMCRHLREAGLNYRTFIPCNLYGPNDNFEEGGHVLASLVRKVVDAKRNNEDVVSIWGTGYQRREFMHVDDAAEAIVHVASIPLPPMYGEVNIGVGGDVSIRELAVLIKAAANWNGKFEYDVYKPVGMETKLLSIDLLKSLNFTPKYSLMDGIREVVEHYESSLN